MEGERRESKRHKSLSSPTLARRAVVSDWHGKISRTISIDRLPEEGKRLNKSASKLVRASLLPTRPPRRSADRCSDDCVHLRAVRSLDARPLPHDQSTRLPQVRMASEDSVDRRAIHLLLRPREWAAQSGDRVFPLNPDDVIALCDLVQPIFESEPTLLQLSAPIKVFGDLHGQYSDLMRLFESYGVPKKEGGDIGACKLVTQTIARSLPPNHAQL